MPALGRSMRKFTREQMGALRSGNLVSDRETQEFEDSARRAAQATQQAQMTAMNRAAAANKAGSPVVAGTLKDTAKQIAQKGADTAVKASGQAAQFSQALRQQREAQIVQRAQQQMAQNRADLAMTGQFIGGLITSELNV